jgi:hypothetical protein
MSPTQSKSTSPPPLENVVEDNRQVMDEIREAAEELTVVHAVLATETAKVNPSEDTKQAVKRTNEVRSMLKASASKLAEATDALEQHVTTPEECNKGASPSSGSSSGCLPLPR